MCYCQLSLGQNILCKTLQSIEQVELKRWQCISIHSVSSFIRGQTDTGIKENKQHETVETVG